MAWPWSKSGKGKGYDEALKRIAAWREGCLDLSGLGLTDVPPELRKLTALTRLYLEDNQLQSLSPELCKLTALTELWLKNNQLQSLPRDMGMLTALTQLSLNNNQLQSVPAGLGNLTALRGLWLNNNQLQSLPPELGKLTALTQLSLHSNQLKSLPPELGKLTALTQLLLNNNQLQSLPPELGKLTALTQLSLENNQLQSLPSKLGKLTALTHLWLHHNQLQLLPYEIGQLATLTHLWLGNNQLKRLPPHLGNLSALKELRLDNNQLQSLPLRLGKLTDLTLLWLHDNPKLALPAEVLRGSPQAQFDYYFSRALDGEAAIQEVRVLLIGRGRVGKTSLLRVLQKQDAQLNEKETPGITVSKLRLKCERGRALAHVWDFGGQEFLHGTHQIFLSERCVYVLVMEGREGNWESESDYWIRFIQSFGGESPVIVALNKFDAHSFTVDRFRLQERCPQIVGFVQTDAMTKLGVDALRGLLAQTVGKMESVWLPVSKRWHRVKERLSEMDECFLEYSEYVVRCVEAGVKDEGQQASLAEVLHRLGVALNFRDHARLRETSVLKPEWVTDGIYGLLRFVQAKQSHGVLQRAELARALDKDRYPAGKHGFLLELMERFEVAFALEGGRYLIPELLNEAQPEEFREFRGAGVKRVRFTYPEALPPGLLPRFIVRTHEMSEGHQDWRWRSGVVLEWGECKALVRLFRNERQTLVEVIDCPDNDRQGLFDLVRSHLTVLHGKVRVIEEVELPGHPGTWVSAEKLRLLEQRGRTETEQETKENTLATVPVKPTLDEVESPASREAQGPAAQARMRLFVSYAHADLRSLKGLKTILTVLGRQGYIQTWEDTQLIAGDEWKERILEELRAADIVLVVHSTNSQASRFIQETELPEALALRNATVLVVPLDRKGFDESEVALRVIQTATWEAKPVLDFSPQRKGWLEVEASIKKVVLKRRDGK